MVFYNKSLNLHHAGVFLSLLLSGVIIVMQGSYFFLVQGIMLCVLNLHTHTSSLNSPQASTYCEVVLVTINSNYHEMTYSKHNGVFFVPEMIHEIAF